MNYYRCDCIFAIFIQTYYYIPDFSLYFSFPDNDDKVLFYRMVLELRKYPETLTLQKEDLMALCNLLFVKRFQIS